MEFIEFFENHHGYARMKDLKKNGFHTRTISKALEENLIEKIKPGYYKLIDYDWNENSDFIDINNIKNNAVICLCTALQYYNLSTINPNIIQIAVPHNTARFNLDYPPTKVFYFSDTFYPIEIKEINTEQGNFKIYSIEKTICDIFRYRNKLGEDIALEALKNYVNSQNTDLNKLSIISNMCKINKIIEPYVKAMVSD
jgi:predicted transcriptional regulator of viral defense system